MQREERVRRRTGEGRGELLRKRSERQARSQGCSFETEISAMIELL